MESSAHQEGFDTAEGSNPQSRRIFTPDTVHATPEDPAASNGSQSLPVAWYPTGMQESCCEKEPTEWTSCVTQATNTNEDSDDSAEAEHTEDTLFGAPSVCVCDSSEQSSRVYGF